MFERTINEVSRARAALIGGVSYALIFLLAIFANFLSINQLVVRGEPAATAANIIEADGLLRGGLASFMAVFVLDVIAAWALFIVFRPGNRDVSLLAAWFRIVGATLLGASLVFLYLTSQLLGSAEYAALTPTVRDTQAMLFLTGFDFLWLTGLVCFGVHLIALGYLIVRSTLAPKVLGMLLALAGTAYIVVTFAHALLSSYDSYRTVFLVMVATSSIVAELWLTLWLLLRAGKRSVDLPVPTPARV